LGTEGNKQQISLITEANYKPSRNDDTWSIQDERRRLLPQVVIWHYLSVLFLQHSSSTELQNCAALLYKGGHLGQSGLQENIYTADLVQVQEGPAEI